MKKPEIDIDAIIQKGSKLADEVEVFTVTADELSVEQRQMKISNVVESTNTEIYIRTITNGKIGVSSTSNPDKWEDCLNSALSTSKISKSINGWTGLPTKMSIPSGPEPFDPNITMDPSLASDIIDKMNTGATQYPESRVITASVSLSESQSVLSNTNGIWYERKHTDISVGIDAISDTSTGYEYDSSPYLSRINPEKLGENACFLAYSSKNGLNIKTEKRDVVLSERVVYSLILQIISDAINGKNALIGRSVYSKKLGEEITDTSFSLTDIPMNKNGNSLRKFDSEGTITQNCNIIDKGVLTSFLYDCKTAAQANTVSTGHAYLTGTGSTDISPHCLCINGKSTDITQDPCIYVHEVVGAHTSNPLTGDFSVEVANGYTMESGKLGQPIKKAMIAGNIFEILKQIDGFSTDTKTIGNAIVPKMRINNLQVIGNS